MCKSRESPSQNNFLHAKKQHQYIYIYCEWVTEVAHKQNCQSRNVPMGPTANSKLFCACRWSVKSETLERLEKVVLATAIEEIGHDLSSKWQRHSTPTTDAKATYPWADHSHVSAEMQKVKNGCGFTWMDDGMLLDWGLVYVVDTYTFHTPKESWFSSFVEFCNHLILLRAVARSLRILFSSWRT